MLCLDCTFQSDENTGLHDLEDPGGGGENVPLAQYGINLQEIYKKFATKATKVIWTTTTPCPNVTTSYGRTNALVQAYVPPFDIPLCKHVHSRMCPEYNDSMMMRSHIRTICLTAVALSLALTKHPPPTHTQTHIHVNLLDSGTILRR